MIHPYCILRFLWRTIRVGAHVSGHAYVTSKEKTPPNVHVIECEDCGHVSVAWSWNSFGELK